MKTVLLITAATWVVGFVVIVALSVRKAYRRRKTVERLMAVVFPID